MGRPVLVYHVALSPILHSSRNCHQVGCGDKHFMDILSSFSLCTIIKFIVFSLLISSLSALYCIVQVETEEDSLSQAAFNQLEEKLH